MLKTLLRYYMLYGKIIYFIVLIHIYVLWFYCP